MKTVFVFVVLVFFAAGASADSVRDKKAKAAAEKFLTESAAKMKTACESTKITAKVNWAAYTDKLMEYGKKRQTESYQMYDAAKNRGEDAFDVMIKTCADADFKKEVSKITSIVLNPVGPTDKDFPVFKFHRSGTTITVDYDASGRYTPDGSWRGDFESLF